MFVKDLVLGNVYNQIIDEVFPHIKIKAYKPFNSQNNGLYFYKDTISFYYKPSTIDSYRIDIYLYSRNIMLSKFKYMPEKDIGGYIIINSHPHTKIIHLAFVELVKHFNLK
jgi:hypothetical protein